jgi:hypothetical protein
VLLHGDCLELMKAIEQDDKYFEIAKKRIAEAHSII